MQLETQEESGRTAQRAARTQGSTAAGAASALHNGLPLPLRTADATCSAPRLLQTGGEWKHLLPCTVRYGPFPRVWALISCERSKECQETQQQRNLCLCSRTRAALPTHPLVREHGGTFPLRAPAPARPATLRRGAEGWIWHGASCVRSIAGVVGKACPH